MYHRFRRALAPVVLGFGGLSCAVHGSYDHRSTPVVSNKECRTSGRIIPDVGPLDAIGTLLVGGAGMTAGLRDENRDRFGFVATVLGLFGLWASQRNDSRLKVQLCAVPDTSAIDSLRSHSFARGASAGISVGRIPAAP